MESKRVFFVAHMEPENGQKRRFTLENLPFQGLLFEFVGSKRIQRKVFWTICHLLCWFTRGQWVYQPWLISG